jgi:hypothetical protein
MLGGMDGAMMDGAVDGLSDGLSDKQLMDYWKGHRMEYRMERQRLSTKASRILNQMEW